MSWLPLQYPVGAIQCARMGVARWTAPLAAFLPYPSTLQSTTVATVCSSGLPQAAVVR